MKFQPDSFDGTNAITRPLGPTNSNSASECPPGPSVASTTVAPGTGRNNASDSWRSTGR